MIIYDKNERTGTRMKEIMTDVAFRKKIERDATGGYLFFGDEDYLKAFALKAAREAACPDPSLAVFNNMNVDCTATENFIDQLWSAIAAAPMMADTKLVTMTGLDVGSLKASELDSLCSAIASIEEFDFNLLIISVPAGMLDEGYLPKRPSATLQKLCEHLTPVHFPKVAPQKLGGWIVRHFEHNGVKAEAGVPAAIIERCGGDMFTLSGEVDKLSFYALANGRDVVTLDDVPLVTCPNDEFDSFALSTAVATGNSARALDVIALMKARKIEPVIVMAELSKTLGDMLAVRVLADARKSPSEIAAALKIKSEYQVKMIMSRAQDVSLDYLRDAVEACCAADAALKLSPTGYVEIEKLVCGLNKER